jgi:phosphate:Na+ symporter
MDDVTPLLTAAGGLGLFLLGMLIMTDGLRTLAGDATRRILMQFTRTPLSGAATGAITTAVLQSSSATTVAAVGFVGAGVLAFPAALGIIFGANIGTTITGWLVVLLGFKLKLGTLMLPVILAGTLLRLFSTGRRGAVGFSLAGFGLIFVGIEFMQTGMSAFDMLITPERMPGDTLGGRLLLVLLGMLATVITQSSSAGVATTLTLLYGGMVSFPQAAALVIGMDIGTTFTALLATVGGTTAARRTGLSHVIYNFLTALLALLLIDVYIAAWESLAPGLLAAQREIGLVAFHTLFNMLGVIVILPFTGRFARLMMALVPDRQPVWTRGLEPALLEQPPLALSAAQAVITDLLRMLITHIHQILQHAASTANLARLKQALDETQAYLDRIHVESHQQARHERLLSLLHALDHLQRLHERCEEDEDRAMVAGKALRLADIHTLLLAETDSLRRDLAKNDWPHAWAHAEKTEDAILAQRQSLRARIVSDTAIDQLTVPESTQRLQALRWMVRVSHHFTRITHYLDRATNAAGKEAG